MGSSLVALRVERARLAADLPLLPSKAFFRDHGAAAATIEMAPWITVETERALAESGYRVTGHEDVMVSGSLRAAPALAVDVVALEEWPAVMHRCYELEPGSPEADLVAASAQIPGCRLYGVRDATDWIACAGTVPYDSIVIFGNDGTRPEARGRGAQRALIDARLDRLPNHGVAVAEVAPGSGSERNYLRCGFDIGYTRTHYVRDLG